MVNNARIGRCICRGRHDFRKLGKWRQMPNEFLDPAHHAQIHRRLAEEQAESQVDRTCECERA